MNSSYASLYCKISGVRKFRRHGSKRAHENAPLVYHHHGAGRCRRRRIPVRYKYLDGYYIFISTRADPLRSTPRERGYPFIFLAIAISSDRAQVDVSRLLAAAARSMALRSSSVNRMRSVLVLASPIFFFGRAMIRIVATKIMQATY